MEVRESNNRPLKDNILLSCGVAGSLLFTFVYSLDGFLHKGYSASHSAISDLELVRNGWIQSLNFIIFGIFVLLFAIGLWREIQNGSAAFWLPFLQILVSLGLIISGVFIYNPTHTMGAMLSFISLVICFFVFARKFYHDPRWKGWTLFSIICGVLMMILLGQFGYAKSHNGPAGIFERLVVLTRLIWSLFFTIRILKGIRLTPTLPKET